jgi:hypothetical protein
MNKNIFKDAEPKSHKKINNKEKEKDDRFDKIFQENKKNIDLMKKKEEEQKIIEKLKINEESFPDLLSINKSNNKKNIITSISNDMKYSEISKKIIINREHIQDISPGWSIIYIDQNNNIIREDSNKIIQMNKMETQGDTFKNNINNCMNQLIENWEKYKENYIDLYGEDEYEKEYLMPYYESIIYDDDSLSDDNDSYYDFDSDYELYY